MIAMATSALAAKAPCLAGIPNPASIAARPSSSSRALVVHNYWSLDCNTRRRHQNVCTRITSDSILQLRREFGAHSGIHVQRMVQVRASGDSRREANADTSSVSERARIPEPEGSSDTPASTSGRPSDPEGNGALYWLIGGLASIGALETAYLTYEKLTGGPVACGLGAGGVGGCSDVLDSEYGTLFGVPLSLFGLAAYSLVLILSQLTRSDQASNPSAPSLNKWLLLAATSAMTAASGYFMYILNFKLTGATCTYCVGSAVLSTSLLLATLTGFKGPDLRKAVAPQLGLSLAVVLALSLAFADVRSASAGSPDDIDLAPVEPEITTVSSSAGTALAKHLKSIGAKMYGAFWCSHCFEQKQAFGQEAMQYVDYVECYPDGYRRNVTLAKPCVDAKIEGFPTWVIDGKLISGEQDLKQLAIVSKFDPSTITQ
ncbi:hypothetical protein KFL_003930040 [Klebsormidium nitens]|uniref:Vitamin K epoxide reductase domain-containing protein n=1 Tax=Klebsormidium nitens TaxID=105231 RepID=A0A0U9HKS0_KLENI|nr:hypothetical protein KFL_003930040 [Klebsormidium nitens]|eukprot:GAQ88001.1 hypothetical protein KFL_003930040 [Klebsormidium nitens]